MSASTVGVARKISILVVGESPHLFSLFRSLERVGCQCQWRFAKSHQEVGKILSHTKLDIILSLNTQRLSEMMAMLEGSSVTMFHMLPVEESCWWLPVLRYGENCLGTPAFRSREFTYVLVEIIEGMIAEGASSDPSAA